MNHRQFKEQYGQEVYNMKVWICDYRLNSNSDGKPIRHVKPTYAQVTSNDQLPSNKNVYCSDFHFCPISSKGLILKKIIVPYDNTGYRSFTGISLNIFLTQKECEDEYNKQCDEAIGDYKRKILGIEELIEDIKKEKIDLFHIHN